MLSSVMAHCNTMCSGSEKSTSSDGEYGDNARGMLLGCRALATSQGGPVVLTPPSATSSAASPRAQKDVILPSAGNLKPSSKSKSPGPSNGTQSTATSQQSAGTGVTIKQVPGIGISIKQEQNSSVTEAEADDDGPDEFEEELDRVQANLNYFMDLAQEAHGSCSKALADLFPEPSKDKTSGK
nr:unnamed protein product [Digitaria exilis]